MILESENILNVLDKASSRTITVFGDYCLDKYLYIDPAHDEPSVETGLTAYQVNAVKLFPGAGGTVTNNLRSLGVNVRCVGLVGEDGEGYDLLRCLKRINADTELMVQSDTIPTNTYMKPMRKTGNETYAETNRIDLRSFHETAQELEDRLIENLRKALELSQGIVIVEQFLRRNCSAITDRIRDKIAALALRFPEKFFFADSRGFAQYYRNVIIKCNHSELNKEQSSPFSEQQTLESVIDGAKKLLAINGKAVVVTLGERGSFSFEGDTMVHIPAFAVEGPIDIVGAGDAASAGIILGLTLGLTLPESVLLGNCIASITIQQIGVTGSASIEQVKSRLWNQHY